MLQRCKFRKGADIVATVPGLHVDLNNAIETGIIQDTSAQVFHNMMEKVEQVGVVARDVFDIIEYDRSYAKFRRLVEDDEKSKQSK